MKIVSQSLSYGEVLALLKKGNGDFSPSLDSSLDLEQYAQKLSKNADFVLLQDGIDYKGCIAYYKNAEGKFVFITHFWVSRELQGHGYGKQMLTSLIDSFNESYNEIRLEVVKKNTALYFYKKQGFNVVEDHFDKLLMCLVVK